MIMTMDVLRRLLVQSAGGDAEEPELADDVAEVHFEDLGYDSLALMETASLIQREFGVVIPEEQLTEAKTPRELIDIVNGLRAVVE